MKAVDTNILARLVLNDDEDQVRQAWEVMRHPIWVSNTVWMELGWVLSKRLAIARPVVADAIETLLAIDTVHAPDRDGLIWAVDRYRHGADWADVIHLLAARGAADAFVTFDRALVRQCGDAPPIPVEALA